MTAPSIILGRVVQLNAVLFQIMMVSNIFLKMWVIYYHRLIMPNTAAGWHLLWEVGWRESGGIALSPEQFLGGNLAACPAFLPELREVFPSLQSLLNAFSSPPFRTGLMVPGTSPCLGITKAPPPLPTSAHGQEKCRCFISMAGTFPLKLGQLLDLQATDSCTPWHWFLVQVATSSNSSSSSMNAQIGDAEQ